MGAASPPAEPRIYAMAFGQVYPAYVAKAERKGRTREEVDTVICWLTGHTEKSLQAALDQGQTCKAFFALAPLPNPARDAVTGVVCGVRVENVAEPTMREIRILDKLIDELAKGRPMEKILRQP